MTDEILVHISAPATRQTDNLYRNLADAYLEFEPYEHPPGSASSRPNAQSKPIISNHDTPRASSREFMNEIPGSTSMLSTSKESYGSFPSHLSSEDHEKHFSRKHDLDCVPGTTHTSSRLAQLEHMHRKWKDQATPRSSFHKAQKNFSDALPSSDDVDTAFIEDTQLAVQALQSQLYDSYLATSEDDASEADNEPMEDTQQPRMSTSSSDSEDVAQSFVDMTATRPATTVEAERARSDHQGEVHPDGATSVNHIDSEVTQTRKGAVDPSTASKSTTFTGIPFSAFPPAPKVSTTRPGRLPLQVTKHLAAIRAQNPLHFNPSIKLRVPDLDERGYWWVNCSNWAAKLQFDFWSSLSEDVISGRLGWGTTLHRTSQSSATLGQVRLYCWGEIVEHVWLTLWLCSHGEVSGSGSKWYDADNIVVFEVP
jgi:hypothetical protein